MLEERKESVAEIERIMEDEYEYTSLKNEATALKLAIESFMTKEGRKRLEMKGYRWQLIRPVNRIWNAAMLEAKLGTRKFLTISTTTVDPDKIDDQVRKGNLNLDDIQDALEELPKKAYIKRYESSEEAADEEAERVRTAMEIAGDDEHSPGSDSAKPKSKRKRKAAMR